MSCSRYNYCKFIFIFFTVFLLIWNHCLNFFHCWFNTLFLLFFCFLRLFFFYFLSLLFFYFLIYHFFLFFLRLIYICIFLGLNIYIILIIFIRFLLLLFILFNILIVFHNSFFSCLSKFRNALIIIGFLFIWIEYTIILWF